MLEKRADMAQYNSVELGGDFPEGKLSFKMYKPSVWGMFVEYRNLDSDMMNRVNGL